MAKLPTVSSQIPPDLKNFVNRVREAMADTGETGAVTARQLVAAGLATWQNGGLAPVTTYAGTPSAPDGIQITGALANIIIQWNQPLYSGHSYTEIWAAAQTEDQIAANEDPLLADAELVGMAPGTLFAHNIGSGGVRWYWLRHINIEGTAGPYNATLGIRGETGTDPEYMLELLTGQITAGQLHNDLGTKIDQIADIGAMIDENWETRDSDAESLASITTTLQSNLNDQTTLVQQNIESIDGILGKYAVKIDNAGHVAGFGLISENNDGEIRSEFGIRADSFWIAPPAYVSPNPPTENLYKGFVWQEEGNPDNVKYYNGLDSNLEPVWEDGNPVTPFVVRTTESVIEGETVPPGVYMESAYIANGTITNAKIGNAAIDNAKIVNLDASKITTGYLNADRIEAGSISADMIDTRGLTIKDANGNIIFGSGTPLDAGLIDGLGSVALLQEITIEDLSGDFAELIDGKAEMHFTILEPSNGWNPDTYALHVGDTWWNDADKKLKTWVYNESTGEYEWIELTDQTAIDAYAAAQTAQETADGKVSVYTTTVVPLNYEIGDLWSPDGGDETYVCQSDNFVGRDGASWISYRLQDWRLAGDVTSNNTAASITNQGAFATVDQITAGNVSTYIADAAIENAQIGNIIQSNDYVAGSSGWQISKDGEMEMNNATFRGALEMGTDKTGERLEITENAIKVYDENNVLRVVIGSLD